MIKAFKKLMEPLERRVTNMVVRGVAEVINDAGGLQLVQGSMLADEVQDDMERIGQFGFSSNPPVGSEFLALCLGGNRDHPVIIGFENRSLRIKDLLAGESAVYTSGDNFIHLKTTPTGDIVISALSGNVRIEGQTIELHATEELKVDCLGNGFHWTPLTRTDYVIGTTPSTLPIAPPEVPPVA